NNNMVLTATLSTASFAAARALLPTGAVELATVQMPTGKTGTNNAGVTVTQTFQYTATEGGLVWVRNSTELAAWTPAYGAFAWQIDTLTLWVRSGGAWVTGAAGIGGSIVRTGTSGSFSASTWTVLNTGSLWTTDQPVTGGMSVTNGVFTVPITGVYEVVVVFCSPRHARRP
ncbi:hypothetical protein ACC691_36065, partial [Rhizobium johnstonii]|uniref:hypothetical protein n=1 Tax=Rhizobium johnstonii TaxID=3019933 RepID=UPI003F9CDD35